MKPKTANKKKTNVSPTDKAKALTDMQSDTDVNGSYTGAPKNPREVPGTGRGRPVKNLFSVFPFKRGKKNRGSGKSRFPCFFVYENSIIVFITLTLSPQATEKYIAITIPMPSVVLLKYFLK